MEPFEAKRMALAAELTQRGGSRSRFILDLWEDFKEANADLIEKIDGLLSEHGITPDDDEDTGATAWTGGPELSIS